MPFNSSEDYGHLRKGSQSSNLSLASSATLTPIANHQRFVRYAMGNLILAQTPWLMGNVVAWLEYHGFNERWRETFHRNEISGNRFLELANYDPLSVVWRLVSRLLGDDSAKGIEHFILLLKAEIAQDDERPDLRSEHRKSSSSTWSIPPLKARPYSYIEPTRTPKDHAKKFFTKHSRNLSSELSKELSPDLAPLKKTGILSSLRKYGGEKAANIAKAAPSLTKQGSFRRKKDTGQKQKLKVDPVSLSPLYAEVLSPVLVSSDRLSALKLVFSMKTEKPSPEAASFSGNSTSTTTRLSSEKLSSDRLASEQLSSSTNSCTPAKVPKVIAEEVKDSPVPASIDPKYLPVHQQQELSRVVLITKDNRNFVPVTYEAAELSDIDKLKSKLKTRLEILDIGTILFRFTDFNASPGAAVPDAVLTTALESHSTLKLKIEQIINSPMGSETMSSTSSDTRSFEIGENSGLLYPATPQYLLQDPRDKSVDYVNFKEKTARENPVNAPLRMPNLPFTLLMPQIRRVLAPGNAKKNETSSFLVVRREGREIDFDKRRQASNAKAPRLIPNIYSSSVKDLAVLPILALTVHSFKDDGSSSTRPALEAHETEKSFVARRKAPPPPGCSLRGRRSNGSLAVLTHSGVLSVLSVLSFTHSHAASSEVRRFDFSEVSAPPADSDDEDFFSKPLRPQGTTLTSRTGSFSSHDSRSTNAEARQQKSLEDDDFFMKPMTQRKMNVRPPVEEVYENLEKYFPNTILDKPIIDTSPESPGAKVAMNPEPAFSTKRSIARTYSNANKVVAKPDEEILYGDGPTLRRRMKTIRAVANEARKKRLADRKPARKTSPHPFTSLARSNTKLWGLKVVEVTLDQIEKGYVRRVQNMLLGKAEEFAWVKGELIGRGSYGLVFLALNVTTGEMLAVKQMEIQGLEGLDAFHKEVENMKDLDHLNIVQYLGFEQKDQTYILFLEYVAGGSVASCLKSYGKFDESLVKFITRQVLEALRYLHANGILHRDLKADNLLLEIDGTCKISDFGISRKSQDIYSNNAELSMQGSVFWMAPEVIHSMVAEKKQGYSAKVDIWSLGCVVLEMFAGQRPWLNEAVISAIYKLGKTKLAPPIPEDVSAEAKDFLHRCFTIDLEQRPTAEELLAHEFMNIDPSFEFANTKLREFIQFNSRKSMMVR